MGDAEGTPRETAAARRFRLRQREQVLRELAEARALRRRLRPRKARLERERKLVHAATLRR
jgi:hypothetical protein